MVSYMHPKLSLSRRFRRELSLDPSSPKQHRTSCDDAIRDATSKTSAQLLTLTRRHVNKPFSTSFRQALLTSWFSVLFLFSKLEAINIQSFDPLRNMANSSRFEVLEEQTHFPEGHPSRQEEIEQEETLEEKLQKLLDGDEKDVKKASAAKELGNKCVSLMLSLSFFWCSSAFALFPSYG